MPELPEVEVLRRSLEPHLVGETIAAVDVRSPALREPLDRAALEALAGRRIERLRRRAKYLLVELSGGATLVLHLGMSGRIVLVDPEVPHEPHTHLVFRLGSGRELRFRDPRRFGRAFVLPTAGLAADPRFSELGIEPLGGEGAAGEAAESGRRAAGTGGELREGTAGAAVGGAEPSQALDGDHLRRAARGRRGPVKPFLMDATVVVGVGNIYASEALWAAGIHPNRSVSRISAARWDRLAAACREVLLRAIAEGGTTLNDFTDGEGRSGEFQVSLAVYDREGLPCPRCATPVRRIAQSGRSTFYCPGCQT